MSNTTTAIYRGVVDDVCDKVQCEFINAGIDESVLSDLKTIWLHKLALSRVLSHENGGLDPRDFELHEPEDDHPFQQQHQDLMSIYAPNAAASSSASLSNAMDPFQQMYNISTLSQNRGDYTYANAPPPSRSNNAAPNTQQYNNNNNNNYNGNYQFPPQTDGAGDQLPNQIVKPVVLPQLDGGYDGSDDEASEGDSEDEEAFAAQIPIPGANNNQAPPQITQPPVNEEELLGSDLDDEDSDTGNDVNVDNETSNRILCQWEKVTRTKNKWKCVLKDGVANVNGSDYIFQRAQCDFEF